MLQFGKGAALNTPLPVAMQSSLTRSLFFSTRRAKSLKMVKWTKCIALVKCCNLFVSHSMQTSWVTSVTFFKCSYVMDGLNDKE